MAELRHTDNEAISMMHQNTAQSFRLVADFAEKHNYTAEDIIEYLRELADEAEAQAIVVDLRDSMA